MKKHLRYVAALLCLVLAVCALFACADEHEDTDDSRSLNDKLTNDSLPSNEGGTSAESAYSKSAVILLGEAPTLYESHFSEDDKLVRETYTALNFDPQCDIRIEYTYGSNGKISGVSVYDYGDLKVYSSSPLIAKDNENINVEEGTDVICYREDGTLSRVGIGYYSMYTSFDENGRMISTLRTDQFNGTTSVYPEYNENGLVSTGRYEGNSMNGTYTVYYKDGTVPTAITLSDHSRIFEYELDYGESGELVRLNCREKSGDGGKVYNSTSYEAEYDDAMTLVRSVRSYYSEDSADPHSTIEYKYGANKKISETISTNFNGKEIASTIKQQNEYTPEGRISKEVSNRYNGEGLLDYGSTTTYEYDASGKLTRKRYVMHDRDLNPVYEQVFDGDGNLIS